MDENYDENLSFSKTSKINSAMIVNISLNNLWIDFYRHYRLGRYLSSNNDLDCIWTILGGEDGIEKSSIETNYLLIEKELKESGSLQDSLVTRGFDSINKEDLQKFTKQKNILLRKSLFLRRLQNKQGKGTAYDMGEDEYMDD